jgi:hypothetical protein
MKHIARGALFALLSFCLSALVTGWPLRAAPQSPRTAGPPKLEDGTPVKIRLQRTLSSADAQVDEQVDFDVLEEIKVGALTVIPKGSTAWGTVTAAQPKRRMGRGGKLDVNIDAVRLADGEKAALRGVKDVKGGEHTGAMTGAIVATSLIVWPAAPFFLFMHGKDITIPKGTELTVYVNGDFAIDPAKFGASGDTGQSAARSSVGAQATSQVTPNAPPPNSATKDELSTAVVKSTPDGADVMVDGKYMGSTPSTVRLATGDHAISVEKSGFKRWERTVTVNPGGIITVDAILEKNP